MRLSFHRFPDFVKRLLVFALSIFVLTAFCSGQNWSGILDPTRAIDWSSAGAGAIPARTTICTTLNPGTTVALINAAITACPSGQTVFLSSGTYFLSGGIVIIGQSNVTLRGAGASQTFLLFSAGGAGGIFYTANNDTDFSDAPSNVASWTAGYAPGTTSITLNSFTVGSITNLHVGSLLILDQLDDASDPGNIFVCQNSGSNGTCSQEGSSHNGRAGRSQNQQVTVTSISGTGPWTVGITPGLYAQNWRGGQTPGVWFSNALPSTGVGYENFSVDASAVSGSSASGIFRYQNVANSWIKGVRSINSTGNVAFGRHVWLYQSSHMTVRDSYFYGAGGASNAYGVDTSFSSSDNLVENNIFQHIATATIREGDAGSVFGYNYAVDNFYTAGGGGWQQGDAYNHAEGDHGLWEGNIGSELELDDIHSTGFMFTAFRNYWTGFDTGTAGGVKTSQTVPIQIYAGTRYTNLVGNVLGKPGYHTIYSTVAPNTTDCGNLGNGNKSIYDIGYSSEMGTRFAPLATCGAGLGAAFLINNDPLAVSTLMRWGNYDTVHAANQFVSGEVPSGLSPYGNAVPASQTLPPSFYLNSQPSWWGTMPWPAIGPDVTGGTGPGGRSYLTPAAACYLNTMGGHIDGSSVALSFNPTTCYTPVAPGSPGGLSFSAPLSLSSGILASGFAAGPTDTNNLWCPVTSSPTWGISDGPALLPTDCFNTASVNTPAPGAVVNVSTAGQLTSALAAAVCGQQITLLAGASFAGHFTITNTCPSNNYLWIVTSGLASLPAEGARYTATYNGATLNPPQFGPCYAGVASLPGRPPFNCPLTPGTYTAQIITPDSSPAISFGSGASGIRISGIEVTRTPGTGFTNFLFKADNLNLSHIILDRIWCHGDEQQDETERCINISSDSYFAAIDSYFGDFYCISGIGVCTEAQDIFGGLNTLNSVTETGIKVLNSFLEAACQSFFLGGGTTNTTPSNIEFRLNTLFKPLTWNSADPSYNGGVSGHAYEVKNNFELKNAQLLLFEGNQIVNDWGGFTQNGAAILLTPKNQSGGGGTNLCSNCFVSNVTMRYFTVTTSGSIAELATVSNGNPGGNSAGGNHWSLHDFVGDNQGYAHCSSCSTLQAIELYTQYDLTLASQTEHDISVNHGTIVYASGVTPTSVLLLAGPKIATGNNMSAITFTNNVMLSGTSGTFNAVGGGITANCSFGQSGGTNMINACWSPYTFGGNCFIANGSISWPGSNVTSIASQTAAFVNYNAGVNGDYTVAAGACKGAGLDGRDPGANLTSIAQVLAGGVPH